MKKIRITKMFPATLVPDKYIKPAVGIYVDVNIDEVRAYLGKPKDWVGETEGVIVMACDFVEALRLDNRRNAEAVAFWRQHPGQTLWFHKDVCEVVSE